MTETPRPTVSVLIACWNAAGSVERALGSVLQERAIALEVVVVDDGSTDGTAALAAAVAARDPRVVVLPLAENGGVANARNRGLEMVRGEWVTVLDADDAFLAGGLDTLVRAGVERAARAVVGQQVWTDGRRRWITELYDIADIRTARRTSLAASPGLLYFASPHAKLFRRECVDGLRFEGRVLGDQPWVVRGLLRAGDAVEVLGETVYEWWRPTRAARADATSITASSRSAARRGVEAAAVAIGALREVLAEAEQQVSDPVARDRVGVTYMERLLRSDLGAHLAGALARRDPDTAELIHAVEAFVESAPVALVAGSGALAVDILAPILRRWPVLDPASRTAAESLIANARRIDPGMAGRAALLGAAGLRRWPEADGSRWRRAAAILFLNVESGRIALAKVPRRLWRRRGRPDREVPDPVLRFPADVPR